jgi:hypothetical protein
MPQSYAISRYSRRFVNDITRCEQDNAIRFRAALPLNFDHARLYCRIETAGPICRQQFLSAEHVVDGPS